jgi:hypothetical protein
MVEELAIFNVSEEYQNLSRKIIMLENITLKTINTLPH